MAQDGFERRKSKRDEKAKARYLNASVSLGEFVRSVIQTTKIVTDIVCSRLGIDVPQLERIENNDLPPESIPVGVSVNILKFFQLTMDNLRQLLNNTLKILKIYSIYTIFCINLIKSINK